MHVVLVTLGTDGDVFPYVGLGATLRQRGHRITLMTNGQHRVTAERHAFEFHELVTAQEHDELFGHRDFWNPLKTATLMARWGVRFIRRHYDVLSRQVGADTVLISNPGVLAASMVHEKFGTPWANLVLQPWAIPSSVAPPVMPFFGWLSHAPRPAWKAFWRCLDLAVDTLVGREANALRRELGLKEQSRIFSNWLSRQLAIGMFPDWFGPPQTDWPRQLRLVGFPLFDGGEQALPEKLMEFCRRGKRPIAFTFGTGMAHSAELFRAAIEACDLLGARGVFLTKFRDQLPPALPESIAHYSFAPFQTLFPMCDAVVHHGGIGTVAKALFAGTPQLIHPLCFDQKDNAVRVRKLGAGDFLRQRRANGRQVAEALEGVLTDGMRVNARRAAERFMGGNALEAAADLIEALPKTGRVEANGRPSSSCDANIAPV